MQPVGWATPLMQPAGLATPLMQPAALVGAVIMSAFHQSGVLVLYGLQSFISSPLPVPCLQYVTQMVEFSLDQVSLKLTKDKER